MVVIGFLIIFILLSISSYFFLKKDDKKKLEREEQECRNTLDKYHEYLILQDRFYNWGVNPKKIKNFTGLGYFRYRNIDLETLKDRIETIERTAPSLPGVKYKNREKALNELIQ